MRAGVRIAFDGWCRRASAATGALFYAWYQGASTLSDFNKTLALSGNSAGLTADRMLVLARNGQSAGLTFNQTSEALTELINAECAPGRISMI